MVGHIDELAKGESIKSSRFLGNMVYFVTFRNTDPLFAVDASNPENPVIVNEVKLPGFSEYLHPYGDGLLFGLGYEADESDGKLRNVKMSMFDISNPADIVEVDREQLEAFYSGAMYEHRAMLVNPKRNLIGFAVEENVIEKMEPVLMCMAGLHRYTDCIPTMKMRALYSISSAFLTCIPMITQELITSVIICIYLMEHEAYTHTGLRTMNFLE